MNQQTWCLNNLATMSAKKFADEYKYSNPRVLSHQYLKIIKEITTGEEQKRLVKEYNAWKRSEDYEKYWNEKTKDLKDRNGTESKVEEKEENKESDKEDQKQEKKTSINSSQSKSNKKLTAAEKQRVLSNYAAIPENQFWYLSTGTCVNEKMKQLVELSVFEHPVHSLIFDPDDQIWLEYFSVDELDEIRTFKQKPLQELPTDLQNCLDIYDKQWKDGVELYQFASSQQFHPINDFEKNWVRESMMQVAKLFLSGTSRSMESMSEADQLHHLWSFVYHLYDISEIKALLGERSSGATSFARNQSRSLEVSNTRIRKNIGAKLDILYKWYSNEVGSCEVGKNDVESTDDKYINDGLMKLPKTLKDMLCVLQRENPEKVSSLKSIGLLIMGNKLELIVMDVPVGNHISRISRTMPFGFPSSIEQVNTNFLPLLELAWKGKQAMEELVAVLKNRKRKAVELRSTAITKSNMPFTLYREK
ncbi:hypothetical protein A0J61_11175 [Choanephora cucurbitarum]|uniref:Uncharacterized protein n=1 Tax=Choanephora cucurbitarum TaxID=101091 RepID=A0A1C7MWE2_9FUNG|nr:hypothetical protein A0J61_11175 [Choanephora cucurbitarum]